MPLRLLFNGDRILGGVSAYSKIMFETCTRLAKENYKVAHIPMGRANRMGIQNFQNVLVYPSGNHPFNEDIAIEHYLNFKADLLITVKEPWCVPGDTLLQTSIGPICIKDFVENELWKHIKVIGSKGLVKVLNAFKLPWKKPLIEIKTTSGKKIELTSDNLIYVFGKGWVSPLGVRCGDKLISLVTHVYEREICNEKSKRLGMDYMVGRGTKSTCEILSHNAQGRFTKTLTEEIVAFHTSKGKQTENRQMPICVQEMDKRRNGTTDKLVQTANSADRSCENSGTPPRFSAFKSNRNGTNKKLSYVSNKLDTRRRPNYNEDISNGITAENSGRFTKSHLAIRNSQSMLVGHEAHGDRFHERENRQNNPLSRFDARDRQSIFGRNNRRRGVNRDFNIPYTKGQPIYSDVLRDNKYFDRSYELVGEQDICQTFDSPQITVSGWKVGEETIIQDYNRNKENICVDTSNISILGYQKERSRNISEICTVKTNKTNAVFLRGRGATIDTRDEKFKSEIIVSVEKIPYDDWVYDLTTESDDFFANELLIHNCFNSLYQWAINFVPFCPIDHSPVSPIMTSRLHTAFKVIAVSRFGQRELKEAGIESIYIPHGVDCEVYRPLPEHKSECKKMFGLPPDDFTVGVIAMNRARKMLPRMLRGYARFKELNPDIKTHMLLWTDIRPANEYEESPMGIADVSVDLLPEIMQLGLGEAIVWPDRKLVREGLPEWMGEDYRTGWDMVKLYGSFDVLLNCTGGEGFGMPHLEAQACGVAPVTTDYAAGPETAGVGLTVEPVDYVIMNTPGTRFALASIDGMAEALTRIYNADRIKLAKKARAFAERYDWKIIIDAYWKPFLEQCETELYPLVKKEGVFSWA